MLTPPLCESNMAALLLAARFGKELRVSSYVFADEFRVNPHFHLEPDYITKKGI